MKREYGLGGMAPCVEWERRLFDVEEEALMSEVEERYEALVPLFKYWEKTKDLVGELLHFLTA